MTSPVARISGPRTVSSSGNRFHGRTASFTETYGGIGVSRGTTPRARNEAIDSPSITHVATLAKGTPVAFEMNGTVREARGFASRTNTSSPRTANWMFSSPHTSRPSARDNVILSISLRAVSDRVGGGTTHAESPECTPASSTCSMIPPMYRSVPSYTASTSTSIEDSRNSSISSGESDRSTSPPGTRVYNSET